MAETTTAVAAKPAEGQSAALLLILKLRTFIALIAVVVFFCLMAPNFVSVGNAVIVSKHVAINAFLAIGMTFVILTGGIDLSVGAIVGLVGMVAGALVLYGIPMLLAGIALMGARAALDRSPFIPPDLVPFFTRLRAFFCCWGWMYILGLFLGILFLLIYTGIALWTVSAGQVAPHHIFAK